MGLIRRGAFCNESTLFQRVCAPRKTSVFCFGGGGSGLSKESQEMIDKYFGWEYMGEAQFEFGKAAECLAFMFENRDKLVTCENNGYFFLVREDVKDQAFAQFAAVEKKGGGHGRSLGLKRAETLGWFDFENGYFVGRTAEIRDAVKQLLDEDAEDEAPNDLAN
jgi:hypothetical protein